MAQIAKALRKEMVDVLIRDMYRLRKAEFEGVEFESPIQGWQDKVKYHTYGCSFTEEKHSNRVSNQDYEEQFRNPQIEEA